MTQKPEIWCIGGRQGSGKTTLAQQLAADGSYTHIDRDTELRRLLSLYNEKAFLRVLDLSQYRSVFEWKKAVDQFAGRLRADIRHYIRLLHESKNSNLLGITHVLENILRRDNEHVLQMFSHSQTISATYSIFADLKTLEQAIQVAKRTGQPVLFNNVAFSTQEHRETTVRLLQDHGIDPRLIIVRSTAQRLVAVARKRLRDPNRILGQANISSLGQFDPYIPSEGWDRVIVVDNIGDIRDIAQTVRSKIALNTPDTLTDPVSFLVN